MYVLSEKGVGSASHTFEELSLDTNTLMDNISQVQKIQSNLLHAMIDEIHSANIPYKTLYEDFQSGGWQTAILYEPSNENGDGTVRDGIASPTPLAISLPITRQFLEKLGLDFFTVRIARNEPDSWLWEHRDYIELDEDKTRLRLHVPLVTNPNAIMQFSQCTVHMVLGWIWKLDPSVSHAISNTGTDSRIHLILDCYKNLRLRKLLSNETLEEEYMRRLPTLSLEERRALFTYVKSVFQHEGSGKAEQHLLKTFHKFDLGEETSYDLLIEFYQDMGFRNRENYWIEELITRIYNRDKIDPNAAVSNMRGMLYSNPHASTSDLLQFNIFRKVLDTCRRCPGLVSAYVRGSLARGDFDFHSDIDILCVVTAKKFASFIEEVDAGIKQHHKPVSERWVDTIVKDFGGVGFVYLLEADEGLYQLDLYVACQGHPSLEYLTCIPHKKEIFRKNRKEGGIQHHDTLRYRLHSQMVKEEIQRFHSVKASVSQTLTELSVLGFMIKKCLERGDQFVASNEFNMWKKCIIKLVRHKFDTQYLDYGFYHVLRLSTEADDNGRLYEDLFAINSHPLTKENLTHSHSYAMDFVCKYFPEDFEKEQVLIRCVTRYIMGYKLKPLDDLLAPWTQTLLNLSNSSNIPPTADL